MSIPAKNIKSKKRKE